MLEAEPVLIFVERWNLEYFHEGGSEKHLRGIRGILKVSRTLVDFPELERCIHARRLERSWQRVQELPL